MSTDRLSRLPGPLIAVLGGTNGPSGRLSSMCVRRLHCALALYRRSGHRETVTFALTGAHGHHFNRTRQPHWQYLRRWLVRHGVPARRIRLAVASSRTPEDIQLLAHALRRARPGRLDLVTSDFHARRAQVLAAHFLPSWQVRLHRSACLREFAPARQRQLRAHERNRVHSYLTQGCPTLPAGRLRRGVVILGPTRHPR
jgi:hypothetical protein